MDFVRRLRGRMSVEEALDRYFREVGIPHAMDRDGAGPGADRAGADRRGTSRGRSTRSSGGWAQLRPDQLLDASAAGRRAQEETSLDCRMAASVSDEAIAATHVAMALETVALLADELSADDAIMHYVRYFNLPSIEAQIIFRRTLAAWAERHPVRDPVLGGRRVRRCRPAVRGRGFRSACASSAERPAHGRPPSAGYIFRRALGTPGAGEEALPCGGRTRSDESGARR